MYRTTFAWWVLSFFLALIAGVVAHGTTPPITGLTDDPGEVQLRLDNGDGTFNPVEDLLVSTRMPSENGMVTFSDLFSDGGYFAVQGDSVSELLVPGQIDRLIDSFGDQSVATVTPVDTQSRVSSVILDDTILLGGQRDLAALLVSGNSDAHLSTNRYGLNDVLDLSTSAGVLVEGVVTWDGLGDSGGSIPLMGLGAVDFTNLGQYIGIALRLGFDEAAAGQELTLRAYSGDAGTYSDAVVAMPVTAGGEADAFVTVPFSAFAGDADLTSVDAFQLFIDSTTSSIDGQIDEIGLIGTKRFDFRTIIPVPEVSPPLIIVAAAALLARNRSARRYGTRLDRPG